MLVGANKIAKPSICFKNPVEATGAASEPSGAATAEPSVEDPSAEESEAMETETEIFSADEAEAMQINEALPSQD